MGRSVIGFAAATLLTVSGCSGCGGRVVGSFVRGRCGGGATHPLPRDAVVRELRRSGFAVAAKTNSAECDGGMAYLISNAVEDTDLYSRIEENRGIVYCSLYRHAVFGSRLDSDLYERAFSPIFHGRKAHFWIANLECRLYAGDKRQDQQLRALLTAMNRIAALSTPAKAAR